MWLRKTWKKPSLEIAAETMILSKPTGKLVTDKNEGSKGSRRDIIQKNWHEPRNPQEWGHSTARNIAVFWRKKISQP